MSDRRVFISYAHNDVAWCKEFANALKKRGVPVWVDYERISDTLGDDALREKLFDALSRSAVYVLLISWNALEAPWIVLETTHQRLSAINDAGTDHIARAPHGIWVLIKDDVTPYQMSIVNSILDNAPMTMNGEPLELMNWHRETMRPEHYLDARKLTPDAVAQQLIPVIRRLQRTKFDVRKLDARIDAANAGGDGSRAPARRWWEWWRR